MGDRTQGVRNWLHALVYSLVGAAVLLFFPLAIVLAVVFAILAPLRFFEAAVIALIALAVLWYLSWVKMKTITSTLRNGRFPTIPALLLGPPVVAVALYAGLVLDGTVAWPDLQALAKAIVPVASGETAVAVGLAVFVFAVCAAIAPSLYAARSGDVLTVLMSLVLTTTAIAFFCLAKSVTHEILAVLIYLANILLSAMAYAARRIVSLAHRIANKEPPI